MHEQTAVLVKHSDECVLVTDDDEPERVWQDFDAAIKELHLDGWQVVQGPAAIGPSVAEIDRFHTWGYRLKRSIQ
jgi:hypothetical protein